MRQVKVILREAVLGLGEAGDLVGVKVGYARNYLLPQGKALLATDSKMHELEHHKRVVMEKAARDLKDLKALCDRLESVALEVTARVGEEGKLFGSITTVPYRGAARRKGLPDRPAQDHAQRASSRDRRPRRADSPATRYHGQRSSQDQRRKLIAARLSAAISAAARSGCCTMSP